MVNLTYSVCIVKCFDRCRLEAGPKDTRAVLIEKEDADIDRDQDTVEDVEEDDPVVILEELMENAGQVAHEDDDKKKEALASVGSGHP